MNVSLLSVLSLFTLPNQVLPALVGAITGGLFTFAGTYYVNYRSRKLSRKRLQRGLTAEIRGLELEKIRKSVGDESFESLKQGLEQASENPTVVYELQDDPEQIAKLLTSSISQTTADLWLSTSVFDENLSNIGLLKKEQISEIIGLYNLVDVVEHDLEQLAACIDDDFTDTGGLKNFESTRATTINHLDRLEDQRETVLEMLD